MGKGCEACCTNKDADGELNFPEGKQNDMKTRGYQDYDVRKSQERFPSRGGRVDVTPVDSNAAMRNNAPTKSGSKQSQFSR